MDALINEKAWANLLALAKDAGEEALVEIVSAFLTQLQEMSAKLATAARDAKALSAFAHNLKSSAGGVGAERLAKLGAQWEASALRGTLPDAKALAELGGAIAATQQELKRRLAARGAKAA